MVWVRIKLKSDKSVMIHTRNLQKLATEMFKIHRNISPPIFSEIFHRRVMNIIQVLECQKWSQFSSVSGSILYLGLKISDIVPLELKELTIVVAFKKIIKEWKPKNCPCRLFQKYVSNLGFITVTSWAFLTFF